MTAALKSRSFSRSVSSRRSVASPRDSQIASIAAGATSRSVTSTGNQKRQRSRYQLTALPTPKQSKQSAPSSLRPTPLALPIAPSTPAWLQLLLKMQRGSSIVMVLLVAIAMATYGWTVYTQQRWGQEYRKLEALQRQERQIIAADEVLKDQIAREAERPEAGLVMPAPSTTIFLQPAPPRPAAVVPSAPLAPPPPTVPLAY